MIRYEPAHHAWFVVQWFQRLANTPARWGKEIPIDEQRSPKSELQTTFPRATNLTDFLALFAYTATLMIETDLLGIWFAAWAAPFGDVVEFGSWIRPDRRGSEPALVAIDEAHDLVLVDHPVLMGLTPRKDLHKLHLKLGYTYTGYLPGFSNGATLYLYAMTPTSRDIAREERRRRIDRTVAAFGRIGAILN